MGAPTGSELSPLTKILIIELCSQWGQVSHHCQTGATPPWAHCVSSEPKGWHRQGGIRSTRGSHIAQHNSRLIPRMQLAGSLSLGSVWCRVRPSLWLKPCGTFAVSAHSQYLTQCLLLGGWGADVPYGPLEYLSTGVIDENFVKGWQVETRGQWPEKGWEVLLEKSDLLSLAPTFPLEPQCPLHPTCYCCALCSLTPHSEQDSG